MKIQYEIPYNTINKEEFLRILKSCTDRNGIIKEDFLKINHLRIDMGLIKRIF